MQEILSATHADNLHHGGEYFSPPLSPTSPTSSPERGGGGGSGSSGGGNSNMGGGGGYLFVLCENKKCFLVTLNKQYVDLMYSRVLLIITVIFVFS